MTTGGGGGFAPTPLLEGWCLYKRKSQGLLTLTSPTTIFAAGSDTDTEYASFTPGWTMQFADDNYVDMDISVRGYVRFDGTAHGSTNANLFTSNDAVMLAPWWDTLKAAITTGYVKIETLGSTPFRKAVVEWNVYANNAHDASNHDLLQFQLVIHENDNRIEFRYGPRTRTGSPATGGYGASVGARNDAALGGDEYRDFEGGDDHALNGSATTSVSTLAADVDWPNDADTPYDWVFEPNVPAPEAYEPISRERFLGVLEGDSEPIIAMGRNVNWLYLNHRPPLLNCCPDVDADNLHRLVIPLEPAADSDSVLDQPIKYTALIGYYTAAGGDLTFRAMDYDDPGSGASPAYPQPAGTGWSVLQTATTWAPTAATLEWKEISTLALQPSCGLVQFELSSVNTVEWHALIIYPKTSPYTLYADYLLEGIRPSGFSPFALGQIAQLGAALHPEILNRLYRSAAAVARDRRQCVFSYVQSASVKTRTSSSVYRPAALLAYGPGMIRGQVGARLQVDIYAYDTTDGGELVVGEVGGDRVTFTVNKNGDTYRHQRAWFTLRSDAPVFYAQTVAAGTMFVMAALITWRPGDV